MKDSEDLLRDFQENMDFNFPQWRSTRILVACSGGLDSMVLSSLLQRSQIQIGLAHCNYNLRGEDSYGDELLVKSLAEENQIPFFSKDCRISKDQNIQLSARKMRYEFFDEIAQANNYHNIATAHHADDNIETFFINLFRGSGIKGLSSIPQKRDNIIRPLLPFYKTQILDYARQENIVWREDISNQKTDYIRNKIRLELLPIIENVSNHSIAGINQSIHYLNESRLVLDLYLEEEIQSARINANQFRFQQMNALKLRALLHKMLGPLQCSSDVISEIVDKFDDPGTRNYLFGGHTINVSRGILTLDATPFNEEYLYQDEHELLLSSQRFIFEIIEKPEDLAGNANTAYFDMEKIDFPISVKHWQNGDSFQPFGMKGKKLLSDLFTDLKLSKSEKDSQLVMRSGEKIIWVVGRRISDDIKITANSEKALKCTFAA